MSWVICVIKIYFKNSLIFLYFMMLIPQQMSNLEPSADGGSCQVVANKPLPVAAATPAGTVDNAVGGSCRCRHANTHIHRGRVHRVTRHFLSCCRHHYLTLLHHFHNQGWRGCIDTMIVSQSGRRWRATVWSYEQGTCVVGTTADATTTRSRLTTFAWWRFARRGWHVVTAAATATALRCGWTTAAIATYTRLKRKEKQNISVGTFKKQKTTRYIPFQLQIVRFPSIQPNYDTNPQSPLF